MPISNFFAVLLLGIAGTTMAQQTDSHLNGPGKRNRFNGLSHIEIDLGQKNALVAGFHTFSQLEARQNIDSVLHLFLADYQKVMDSTQNPVQAVHILYRLGDISRTVDSRTTPQPTTSFRFMATRPDPMLVKTRQDTLQVVWSSATTVLPYYSFSLYLLVNQLSDIERLLANGGVNQKVQEAIQRVRQYKGHDLTNPKMAFDLRYKHEGGSIESNFINPGLARSPFISFQPTIGVGLIRNQWVPSVNLDVQLIPSQLHNVGYSVGYTSNFFFSQSATDSRFQAYRNDFLSVGLAFYHYNKDGRTSSFSRQLAAFYVGFPVYRRGTYFEANTIRLSGTLYHKNFIKIQPELYMNGFFKRVYPGVRIGFGL